MAALLVACSSLINPALGRARPALMSSRSPIHLLRSSLIVDEPDEKSRLELIAERYNLNLETDGRQIANIAASSLPEEESGDWGDVAMCTLRNIAAVAVLLGAVGALPGQSSAAEVPATAVASAGPVASAGLLLADAELLDTVAIIVVPLVVGGGAIAWLAANYENLINKFNDGR